MLSTQINPYQLRLQVCIMNAIRKARVLFGIAVILLGVPLAVVADNDDAPPQAVTLAAGVRTISRSAPRVPRSLMALSGNVVFVLWSVSFRPVAERLDGGIWHDCRSKLRSLCLLRC